LLIVSLAKTEVREKKITPLQAKTCVDTRRYDYNIDATMREEQIIFFKSRLKGEMLHLPLCIFPYFVIFVTFVFDIVN